MTTFDVASGVSSQCHMNGYASENNVFSFCPANVLAGKDYSILLGKVMRQEHFR